MPFTFSHPAAVLPLIYVDRKKLSATALTIGSITPDFDYFLNFNKHVIYSHTWLGILWFDLPIAIVLFYLFQLFIKEEVINHLPSFLYNRFCRFRKNRTTTTAGRPIVIVASLLIGIVSHLIWDKLTHRAGDLIEESIDFYSLVWNLNSVIGAFIIGMIIWKIPPVKVNVARRFFFFWARILAVVTVFIILRGMDGADLRQLVVAGISGFFLGLLLTSIITKIWKM